MTSLLLSRGTRAGGAVAYGAPRGVALLLCVAILAVVACSDDKNPDASTSGVRKEQIAPPGPDATPVSDSDDRAGVGASGSAPSNESPDTAREFSLQPDRVDWQGGDHEQGAALFALHCSTCHGVDGKGDGPAAIALDPKPRDLTEGTFSIDANGNNETGESTDLARVILVGPGAFGGSDAMQGWSETLSIDEVRHLVTFVENLAKNRE